MVANWANFPNEILNNVFRVLDKKDNFQCSLTCRPWRSPAQRYLFENIHTTTSKKLNLILSALSVYQDDPCRQSPGNFVKTLSCDYLGESIDVESLDKAFPSLEVIEIRFISIYHQAFHDELYRLIEKGSFPNLRKIPRTQMNDDYLRLALARRENIKELQLQNITSKDTKVFDNLRLFPRLEVFQLHLFSNVMCLESDILSKIRSPMKTIDFLFTHPADLTVNISDVEPLPSIKKVKIFSRGVLSSGDKALLYLMTRFPHVNSLDVNYPFRSICDVPRYAFPTESCLYQFLVYLFDMTGTSKVGPLVTDYYTEDLVAKFFNHVKNSNVDVELKILLDEIKPLEEPVHSQERDVYIQAHNYRDGRRKRCFIKVVYKILTDIPYEPHVELLNKVKDMDIKMISIGNDDDVTDYIPDTPVPLDVIFDQFTHLRQLKISRILRITCTELEEDQQQLTTLESLEFLKCHLTRENFTAISKRFPKLKSLIFSDCVSVNPFYGLRMQRHHKFLVNMPFTRVEELTLSITITELGFCAIYRLITKDKNPRFCHFFSEYFENECTEEEYNLCANSNDYRVFDISFESVKKWTIKINVINDRDEDLEFQKVFQEKDV